MKRTLLFLISALILWGSKQSLSALTPRKPDTCSHQWAPYNKIIRNNLGQYPIRGKQCQFCAKIVPLWYQVNTSNSQQPNSRRQIITWISRSWVHSREEDSTTNGSVFRPAGSRIFPPSLFRMRYQFYPDGTLDYLNIGQSCKHYTLKGRWTLATDNKTLQFFNSQGVSMGIVNLLEIKTNILRFAK
jgi:hypothetical protein